MLKKNYLSKTEAAYEILKESKKPMHVNEIIQIALSRNLIVTKGKTPSSTLASELYLENKRRSSKSKPLRFRKIHGGIWELVETVKLK